MHNNEMIIMVTIKVIKMLIISKKHVNTNSDDNDKSNTNI